MCPAALRRVAAIGYSLLAASCHSQVNCTDLVAGAITVVGKVPVRVTAPLVGARHTAVPFVELLALLISISCGSGFDHVPATIHAIAGTAQCSPAGAEYASFAMNCTWFAGGAAAWFTVALDGLTPTTREALHSVPIVPFPAQPQATATVIAHPASIVARRIARIGPL
jgi:hypothetical protein